MNVVAVNMNSRLKLPVAASKQRKGSGEVWELGRAIRSADGQVTVMRSMKGPCEVRDAVSDQGKAAVNSNV